MAYASLFLSTVLTAFGLSQIVNALQKRASCWLPVTACLFAAAPLIFYLFMVVLPLRLRQGSRSFTSESAPLFAMKTTRGIQSFSPFGMTLG